MHSSCLTDVDHDSCSHRDVHIKCEIGTLSVSGSPSMTYGGLRSDSGVNDSSSGSYYKVTKIDQVELLHRCFIKQVCSVASIKFDILG